MYLDHLRLHPGEIADSSEEENLSRAQILKLGITLDDRVIFHLAAIIIYLLLARGTF